MCCISEIIQVHFSSMNIFILHPSATYLDELLNRSQRRAYILWTLNYNRFLNGRAENLYPLYLLDIHFIYACILTYKYCMADNCTDPEVIFECCIRSFHLVIHRSNYCTVNYQ